MLEPKADYMHALSFLEWDITVLELESSLVMNGNLYNDENYFRLFRKLDQIYWNFSTAVTSGHIKPFRITFKYVWISWMYEFNYVPNNSVWVQLY